MKKFILFFIMWIASNLSIPFWAVGHIHLTMNVYEDIKEIIASFGMNILVATVLRKVSRFVTGTQEDGIIPVPCFYDVKTGKVLVDLLPKELKEMFQDDNI